MRTPTPLLWPLVLILLVSACSDRRDPQPIAVVSAGFPNSFDSVEAAKAWLNRYPTGGRIDRLRLGWRPHLVVFRHGSGLPVVGIGVYRRNLFSWKLISEHRPPHPRWESSAPKSGTERSS